MISSLLFSLSAACLVAMFLPPRPSRPRQELETYYVCDPESLPNRQQAGSSVLLGELCG